MKYSEKMRKTIIMSAQSKNNGLGIVIAGLLLVF